MTPEELIAEQDATITELRAEIAELLADTPDPYWERVYNDIRAAWDAWAFAELGTARPSPVDLEGRPELAALYEAVR